MVGKNDIVQVALGHDWKGCLVVVDEVKHWGIIGYVLIPLRGQAFIRLENNSFVKVGRIAE